MIPSIAALEFAIDQVSDGVKPGMFYQGEVMLHAIFIGPTLSACITYRVQMSTNLIVQQPWKKLPATVTQ